MPTCTLSHVQEFQEEAQDTDSVFCNMYYSPIYKLHFCSFDSEISYSVLPSEWYGYTSEVTRHTYICTHTKRHMG